MRYIYIYIHTYSCTFLPKPYAPRKNGMQKKFLT